MPINNHVWRYHLIALLVFFMSGQPSHAESQSQSACAIQFDQCLKKCDVNFSEQPGRRAACVPVCSGKFAACDAGVAYEKAKPWLEEQTRKSKEFFDGLIEKYGKNSSPPDPLVKIQGDEI